MIVFGIMTALLFALLIIGIVKGKKDSNAASSEPGRLPECFLAFGRWTSKTTDRLSGKAATGSQVRKALLVSEETELRRRAERFFLVWALLFLGMLAGFLITLSGRKKEQITSLERPDFGLEKTVALLVRGLEQEKELSVTVSGQVPGEEEMQEVFLNTFEEMKERWLDENASENEVRSNLSLISEADNGIRFSFRSSDIDYLSDYGTVLSEEIPQEGVSVFLTVRMTYEEYEDEEIWNLRLFPPLEPVLTESEKLEALIREADENSAKEEALILPEEMDGKRFTYEEAGTSPYVPVFLSLFAAVSVFILPGEKQKEDLKKRNAELERTLPGILSKLETLIGAGMSIRGAFFRIAEDYGKGRKEGKKERLYAYEEMLITVKNIQGGMSEKEAYIDFGRRCGAHAYVRLGNLLAKSLKQGISGLSAELRQESVQALQARKEQALRNGETAGTKLLLPMMIMLGVVIATLVIPAFMSF